MTRLARIGRNMLAALILATPMPASISAAQGVATDPAAPVLGDARAQLGDRSNPPDLSTAGGATTVTQTGNAGVAKMTLPTTSATTTTRTSSSSSTFSVVAPDPAPAAAPPSAWVPPPPQHAAPDYTDSAYEIPAGPIWNDSDAARKCPQTCGNNRLGWTGGWRTTQPGKMSVCSCAGDAGVASGPGSSCSVPPNKQCAGCSISCPAGLIAHCKQGDPEFITMHCPTDAKCTCI